MNPMAWRRGNGWILPLVLLLGVGCSSSTGDQDPPLDLVLANIESTDLTVVVDVTLVEELRTEGVYTTWAITGTVVKTFAGDWEVGSAVGYIRTLEAGVAVPTPGSRHLVSFVREDGRLLIPDAGYHFPYTPTLERDLAAALDSP